MANVKRCEKLAFMEVSGTYQRMTNFTEITTTKNPKEYSRQYVDEAFERSNVVGYNPSIAYSFDYDRDNAVHELIKNITDNELIADEAEVKILMVDVANANGKNDGIVRTWSVLPDTEGEGTDAYIYSGSFKACGETETVSVTSTDNWKTAVVG